MPSAEPTSSSRPDGVALGGKVAAGSAVFVAGHAFVRLAGFISIAVLGRLLAPEDFGVVALAMAVVGFVDAAANNQFHLAIMRMPNPTTEHFHTAFTISALWSVAAASTIVALADPIATALGAPDIAPALRVLALQPLFSGFRNPYFTIFEKNLDFRPNFIVMIIPRIAYVIVCISLAFLIRNYWAMIIGQVFMFFIYFLITYIYIPQKLRFSLIKASELLSFGAWLTLAGVTNFIARKAEQPIIGSVIDIESVGIYYLGVEIATLVTQQLALAVAQPIYAGLAAIRGDNARLSAAYFEVQGMLLGAMLPIGCGLGLVANELIVLVVGPTWVQTAIVIQILGPVLAASALTVGAQAYAMVDGDTRLLFIRAVVSVGVLLLGLWLFLERFGLMGAALARMVATVVDICIALTVTRRVTGTSPFAVFFHTWRSFVAAGVMALAVIAVSEMAPWELGAPYYTVLSALLMKATVGASIYILAHASLWALAGKPHGPETRVLAAARRGFEVALRGRRPSP